MIANIFKVFGIVVGCLILLSVVFCLVILSTNMQKRAHEEVWKSKGPSMGKALVIYQPSLTGISSLVAHQIAKGLSDGGYEVTLNHPGKNVSYDVSDYDIAVFGSGAHWSYSSKALVDYMAGIKDYSTTKIVLYSTGIVPDNGDEFVAMEKALHGTEPYKVQKFDANMKKEANEKKAYDFGK